MRPDRAIKKFLNDHPDKMLVNRSYVLELKETISNLEEALKECQAAHRTGGLPGSTHRGRPQ